jgi:hypothetical protein
MPIEANFAFRHAVAANTTLSADLLGPLRGFIGPQIGRPDQPQERAWTGTGCNLIWRPNFSDPPGTPDFFLELNLTNEKLEFLDITGSTGIANRGLLQKDVHLGGLGYLQTIFDRFDNSAQHFEPGVWANVDKTDNPDEPPTVVRMGSIPHGTTINLQGTSFSFQGPQRPRFETAIITPFKIGSRDDGHTNLQPFPDEEDITKSPPTRTDLSHVQGLDQAHLTNPNLFLSDAIANQEFINTTVLEITSDTSAPNSIPQSGGGADNIAFLTGSRIPAGAPNARVSRVTATFWIERVREGGNESDQLQYPQRVLLDFRNLSWPHISVATLRGQPPKLTGPGDI